MPGFAFAVLRISCPAPLTFFVHRAEAFLLGARVARLPAEPTVGRFKLVKEGVAFAYLLPASEGACDTATGSPTTSPGRRLSLGTGAPWPPPFAKAARSSNPSRIRGAGSGHDI
jgi:hypothetical protein